MITFFDKDSFYQYLQTEFGLDARYKTVDLVKAENVKPSEYAYLFRYTPDEPTGGIEPGWYILYGMLHESSKAALNQATAAWHGSEPEKVIQVNDKYDQELSQYDWKFFLYEMMAKVKPPRGYWSDFE